MQRTTWQTGLVVVALLAACHPEAKREQTIAPQSVGESAMSMTLMSQSFAANGEIPAQYTCEGQDLSPELSWSGTPAGAKSLVLILDDPDAPGGTWTHWVLYNLPPTTTSLPEGAATQLPPGTRQGQNSWNRTGYGGPCPPSGRHRYVHTLYALDTVLPDLHEPSRRDIDQAIQGHVLSRTQLIGTYQKHR